MTDSRSEETHPNDDPALTADASAAPVRERIGPYRLLQKVGEGGMGEVWIAEQSEPMHRKVALKIIKAGMDSKAIIARFEAERQALAMMDHACIARVFDAGATERGRPYFVMEYVRGAPVTEYCDRRRLSTTERLQLFIKICEGVQHAHQKAVIHRDLKPSNVLITEQDGRPLPKIIDFGVAKATAQPLTEHTVFTELGMFLGTPEYMSPEQAGQTAEDVDTRTDIYSLGVMLYELLAGALPFDSAELREAGFEGICRIIREKDPLRPSTRVSGLGEKTTEVALKRQTLPHALTGQLRGDLDWIVMKSLEKDRARRYETANGLAADIRRHLKDEPVVASPPSTTYRLRKLVRWNRGAFAAVTAVFMILIVGVTVSTWSMFRAKRAEQWAEMEAIEARRQASIAGAVNQFLNRDLLSAVAPSARRGEGRDVTMREVLDVAGERIDDSSSEGGQFADKPLVEASIRSTLGNTYRALGEYPLAEPHLARAVELTQEALGDADPSLPPRLHDLGGLYFSQGRYDEAELPYRRATDLQRRIGGEDDAEFFRYSLSLALLSQRRGHYEQAENLYRETLAHQERVDGAEAASTTRTMYTLANLCQEIGRYAEAESLQSRVLEVWTRTRGERDPWTLGSMNNLANVYGSQGRLDEAASLMTQTLERKRDVYGPESPTTLNTLTGLAVVAEVRGDYAEAERLHRETLDLRMGVLGDEHPRTLYSLTRLAFAIARQGRFAEAVALGSRARNRCTATLGPAHPYTVSADDVFGVILIGLARFDEAETVLRDLIRKAVEVDEEDPILPFGEAHLAMALSGQDRREEAHRLFEEAIPDLPIWDAEARYIVDTAASMYEAWHQTAPEAGYGQRAVALREASNEAL